MYIILRLFTPALPPADRQVFYGSFMRDMCDKYLTVFADFKIVRSFFDASWRLCRLRRIRSKSRVPTSDSAPFGISVPISNRV